MFFLCEKCNIIFLIHLVRWTFCPLCREESVAFLHAGLLSNCPPYICLCLTWYAGHSVHYVERKELIRRANLAWNRNTSTHDIPMKKNRKLQPMIFLAAPKKTVEALICCLQTWSQGVAVLEPGFEERITTTSKRNDELWHSIKL